MVRPERLGKRAESGSVQSGTPRARDNESFS